MFSAVFILFLSLLHCGSFTVSILIIGRKVCFYAFNDALVISVHFDITAYFLCSFIAEIALLCYAYVIKFIIRSDEE